MRPRLTHATRSGLLAGLLAIVGALAPPFPHRHGPGDAAVPHVEAVGCDRSLADVHLHAAAEHPRRACPVCALGPGSPATVGPTPQTPSADSCRPLPPGAESPLVGWDQPARAARGPPVPVAV